MDDVGAAQGGGGGLNNGLRRGRVRSGGKKGAHCVSKGGGAQIRQLESHISNKCHNKQACMHRHLSAVND